MEGAKPPEVFPHLAKGDGISDEFDDVKPFLDFPDGFVLPPSATFVFREVAKINRSVRLA